jgi:hypothetical protein
MRLHQHAVIISGFQFIKPVAQVVNDLILNAGQRIDLLLFILDFWNASGTAPRRPGGLLSDRAAFPAAR